MAAGPVGARGGDDRLQARERVDAELVHVSPGICRCRLRGRPRERVLARLDERRLAVGVDQQRHREELRDLQLAARSPRPGPRRTGTAAGAAARNFSAAGRLSAALTPRKAISLPRSVATCWKTGNSARQGRHHDAHLLITTGWPSRRVELLVEAAVEDLARLLVQGGERRRGALQLLLAPACEVEARRALSGWSDLPPACVSPMTSTATSATARSGTRRRRIGLQGGRSSVRSAVIGGASRGRPIRGPACSTRSL